MSERRWKSWLTTTEPVDKTVFHDKIGKENNAFSSTLIFFFGKWSFISFEAGSPVFSLNKDMKNLV